MKEKNNLTTNQGMPVFSATDIYKHYLTVEQWNRATMIPSLLTYFERCLRSHLLIEKLQLYIHPELALWATAAPGCESTKKSYETLETYGDTILKIGATLLAYDRLEKQGKANEKHMNDLKDSFITNMHLNKLGYQMGLNHFMRSHDPEPEYWEPPFTTQATNQKEIL